MNIHQVKDTKSDENTKKKRINEKYSEKDAAVLADVHNDSKKVTQ